MKQNERLHIMIIREVVFTALVVLVFGFFFIKDGFTRNYNLALCNTTIVMLVFFVQEHEIKCKLRKNSKQVLSCHV